MRHGCIIAATGWLVQLVLTPSSTAGDAQISGYVRDAVKGKPLMANVSLLGTRQGAVTDSAGFYRFFDASPGTHRVKASALGYAPQTFEEVTVTADMSIALDFALVPSDIEVGEIVVAADRMLLEQSQTTSKTTFSGREVLALPVSSIAEALATAPSIYRGFVRGGDPFHTRSYLDGVDITDRSVPWVADYTGITPYFGYSRVLQPHPGVSTMTDPVMEAVEQASLFVGGYGVDYAGLTGAVTYTLREGSGPLSGSARVRVSQLGGLRHLGPNVYADQDMYYAQRDLLASSVEEANRRAAASYTWTPEKYEYGSKPEVMASIAFGGSLTDGVGLYVTGRWFDAHGRLPNQWTRQLTGTVKATYTPNASVRINALVVIDDKGRLFGWKNSVYDEVFRYFLEGMPLWDGINTVSSLKVSHRLGPNFHHEFQVSYTHDNLRRGFCDDNNDGIISLGEDGDYLQWEDTSQVYRYMNQYAYWDPDRFFTRGDSPSLEKLDVGNGCRVAHPTLFYEDFNQDVLSLKWNGSVVAWRTHMFRFGAEARLHAIGRRIISSGVVVAFPDYKAYGEEVWTRRPKEYTLYLADHIEVEGLFLNIGVRLDAIDRDVSEIIDWYHPHTVGTDGAGGPVMVPVRGEELPVRYLFSPRIGVSHPIRDNAAMYFSFSRAEAFAPYGLLYSNYNSYVSGPLGAYPAVSQEPVSTSNYDLGIQWALDDVTALSVGVYYKESQHAWIMAMSAKPSGPALSQNYSTSAGTMDTRGVEISFRRRIAPVFEFLSAGGTIAYTYSFVKGLFYLGGGRPQTYFDAAAGDSARLGGALPFESFDYADRVYWHDPGWSYLLDGRDHNHRFTLQLYMELPLDIRISALGKFASGFYYWLALSEEEPDFSPLQGPWTKQVDFRIQKGFVIPRIGRLSIFVDLINAFGWTNVVAMQNHPWEPEARAAWEREQDPTGGPGFNRPVNFENVMVYDVPREVYFGVEFSF